MSRASWGKAKLAIYLLKDEILALHAQGATIEETYKELSERLNVGVSTFRRHASEIRRANIKSISATNTSQALETIPPTKAPEAQSPSNHFPKPSFSMGTSKEKPKSFNHDPQASDDDLW